MKISTACEKIKTGAFQFKPGIWVAFYDGKRIAEFTSKGAAMAGIEVEERRLAHKLKNAVAKRLGYPPV